MKKVLVDIKVVADALSVYVESHTGQNLNLPQYAKVLVLFACNQICKMHLVRLNITVISLLDYFHFFHVFAVGAQ